MANINRLKGKNRIQHTYNAGHQIFAYPFKMIWLQRDERDTKNSVYFSIWVGKRNIRKAVDRNMVKRRTRAAIQNYKTLIKDELQQSNDIILIYAGKNVMDFNPIEKSIYTLLNKLIRHSK